MTPEQFLKLEFEQNSIIETAQSTKSVIFDMACKCPLPKKLRPATPEDLVVHAVFWYIGNGSESGHYWHIVGEVLPPQPPYYDYRDYCTNSIYDIRGAFVEIKESEASNELP